MTHRSLELEGGPAQHAEKEGAEMSPHFWEDRASYLSQPEALWSHWKPPWKPGCFQQGAGLEGTLLPFTCPLTPGKWFHFSEPSVPTVTVPAFQGPCEARMPHIWIVREL